MGPCEERARGRRCVECAECVGCAGCGGCVPVDTFVLVSAERTEPEGGKAVRRVLYNGVAAGSV